MKKITMLLLSLLCLTSAKADEGMWTLYDLPQAVFQQMQAEGFKVPFDGLYKNNDAIKNSVVNFGGFCSGVVVSGDGLVFTNHHCGFDAIRRNSSVEHDYMLNGFYAKSFEEELPNKGLFVSFMIDQQDITDKVKQLGLYQLTTGKAKADLIDSLANAMTADIKKEDSTLHVEVDPFYEGNKYYATTYRVYPDVRLVFTIPKSMGKFGGETDNWMWPRQTCDFSVFRIYVDPKTGKPAEYSKDNVPYHPATWTKVSLQGYKDRDYSMTIGYPGSTSRYLSSYGIQERYDMNTLRVQNRAVKQEIMWRHMLANEATRIKYESKYANSSNYWKNSIGMNKCIDSIGLIQQKAAYERQIQEYMDSTGYMKDKLNFATLEKLYKKQSSLMANMMYLRESFFRSDELSERARKIHAMAAESEDKSKKSYLTIKDNSEEWDETTDRELLTAMMENMRQHVSKESLPDFYTVIDNKFGGNCKQYVDAMWSKSILMKKNAKIYNNKKSFYKDLGVQFGLSLTSYQSATYSKIEAISDSIDEQERYLCAVKLRMEQDMPNYSDANFTMRLSYGQVGEFTLNGKPSGYYTEAKSIVEKMNKSDKIMDYQTQPIMKSLFDTNNFGRYADKNTGKMHLCFLTNNDITGGNSGSPIFNGKGELIGLAFDGNWDSLSSDIFFDKQLARCIGVDIRYVLYMMDKWGNADRLIKEINAQ